MGVGWTQPWSRGNPPCRSLSVQEIVRLGDSEWELLPHADEIKAMPNNFNKVY